MQPIVGSGFWFERRLEGLRDHRALGRPVRFYFRRREQLLYLVVGGWNTVFGYAVWAVLQFLLGGYLHYLVIVVLSWPIAVLNAYFGLSLHRVPQPRLGDQGAAAVLRRVRGIAARDPRCAASRAPRPAIQHLRGEGHVHRGPRRRQLPRSQVLQLRRQAARYGVTSLAWSHPSEGV